MIMIDDGLIILWKYFITENQLNFEMIFKIKLLTQNYLWTCIIILQTNLHYLCLSEDLIYK